MPDGAVLLSVVKGLEAGTLLRMSQVLADEVPAGAGRVAALSGPTLALELARGLPAAAVVAAPDDAVSGRVVELLGSRTFRLYRNRDLAGVELAGALKNIVAIVAGAVDGLGAGDNAKAAITTRGLAEVTRLGVAMGANPLTFAGLAGIGDILATCASALSRNHRLGVELAAGRRWAEIESGLPGVAEGAYTVRAAVALADRHGVEMPIAREVHAVLYEDKDVRASVADLLDRTSKDELAGPRLIHLNFGRGVAQPGSALDWGSRGRWFESSRPDHYSEREMALRANRRAIFVGVTTHAGSRERRSQTGGPGRFTSLRAHRFHRPDRATIVAHPVAVAVAHVSMPARGGARPRLTPAPWRNG